MEVFVRYQDSLWHYSRLFDLPLPIILRSNPHVIPSQLTVGTPIQIPGYILRTHTIQPEDTLWKIAQTAQIPLDAIYLVNPLINPIQLQVGQRIQIPQRVTQRVITDVDQYTYEKLVQHTQDLLEIYPFIFQDSIGSSVLGKDLIELQIGIGEKEVHVNGSFHANEWITTPVLMQFLNDYALALTNHEPIRGRDMLPLFQETSLSVVPMVNPDGVNLVLKGASAAEHLEEEVLEINQQSEDFSNWKANIRGVDLNNQFPALWEIEADRKPSEPSPRDYPGPAPLSEPESIAMAELTNERMFQRVNAFHTQGAEIYWGFEGLEPPISETIVNEYARVSGYKPVRYLDSYAGYKDWFIYEFQRPGFTMELGRGVNPLPIDQYPTIYEESLGILLANLYL